MNIDFDYVSCFGARENDNINYAIGSVNSKILSLEKQLTVEAVKEDEKTIDPESVAGKLWAIFLPQIQKEIEKGVAGYTPPLGYFYVQFPESNGAYSSAKEPQALYPNTTWELRFNSEGVFFRTEGGNAANGRAANGIQADAFGTHSHDSTAHTHTQSAHTHTFTGKEKALPISGRGAVTPYDSSYAGSSTAVGTGGYTPKYKPEGTIPKGGGGDKTAGETVTISSAGGVETRPKNRTFKIWERTK